MIKCQICQHENPNGAEYCENCGAALAADATPPTPSLGGAASEPTTQIRPQPLPTGSATPAESSATPDTPPLTPETVPPPPEIPPAPPAAGTVGTPPPSSGGQPRLIAHRYGAASGEEFPLLGDHLVIGRFDPESGPVDIDLSQTPEAVHISRHHAEIYREGDGHWYVKDLGATNGVFVKSAGVSSFGPRLTAPQALGDGDEVAFGNARFIFRAS